MEIDIRRKKLAKLNYLFSIRLWDAMKIHVLQKLPKNLNDLKNAANSFFEQMQRPDEIHKLSTSINGMIQRCQACYITSGENVDNRKIRKENVKQYVEQFGQPKVKPIPVALPVQSNVLHENIRNAPSTSREPLREINQNAYPFGNLASEENFIRNPEHVELENRKLERQRVRKEKEEARRASRETRLAKKTKALPAKTKRIFSASDFR